MMNPTIKALWIDALKSGDYEQGTGQLKDDEGQYCCLGVLCDLAVKAGVATESRTEEDGTYYTSPDASYRRFSDLPEAVQEWAGIDDTGTLPVSVDYTYKPACWCCETEENRTGRTLIALNDMAKYTFSEIADVIEQQF